MAVECKRNCCTPAEDRYPMIMKSKISAAVVLFSAPNHGTVLCTGTSTSLEIGDRKADWSMNAFEPISDDIILRNKQ